MEHFFADQCPTAIFVFHLVLFQDVQFGDLDVYSEDAWMSVSVSFNPYQCDLSPLTVSSPLSLGIPTSLLLKIISLDNHSNLYMTTGIKQYISKNKIILLSCSHTFLIKVLGEVIKISRKFTLGDHILNSHDLRG